MTALTPLPLLTALQDSGHGADGPDAVRVGDSALTRSELIAAASAVANEIAGASSVAVDATASIETVIAVTGCLMAGVPAVPVPPDSGPSERAHILKDSGAQIWLGSSREDISLPSVAVDAQARSSATHREPDPEATAMIMYTSGTTGSPKGVVLSRSAIAAGLDGLAEAWNWSPDDTLVHGLPLFHVHGSSWASWELYGTARPLFTRYDLPPRRMRQHPVRCTSVFPPCGRESARTPRPHGPSHRHGSSSRAVPLCRFHCSNGS